MICVYKSDTGQFVIVHHPSQTVVIHDDLAQAFDKIETQVRENNLGGEFHLTPPFEDSNPVPSNSGSAGSLGGLGKISLIILVLLPFLWLLSLHYTISGVAEEVITYVDRAITNQDLKSNDSGTEIMTIKAQIGELHSNVATLTTQIEAVPGANPEEETKALQREVAFTQAIQDLESAKSQLAQMQIELHALRAQRVQSLNDVPSEDASSPLPLPDSPKN